MENIITAISAVIVLSSLTGVMTRTLMMIVTSKA